MLAMAAGALGLFVIWLLLRLFDANIPDLAIEIDWRSLAFTFSLALVAGVLFGLPRRCTPRGWRCWRR